MMKTKTPILSRCLAMLLALVLSFANVPGLVLTAFAAEATSVNAGKVMADNYTELSDAEKAILKSGYLAGDYTIEYNVPEDGDNLVEVNAETKKIVAGEHADWTAVKAEIVVNDEVVETVSLAKGDNGYSGEYSYDGNAFSVKVTYKLEREVKNQKQMFNAIASLKQGVANLATGYNEDGNLGTVVLAIDTLNDLANGITMQFGTASMTAQFGSAAISAVESLKEQIDANGELDLQAMNREYSASSAKTKYLAESGAVYQLALVETYNSLKAIKEDPLANNPMLDAYLQGNDTASYTKWMAFKNILANLVSTLEPAANAELTTENLVKDDADYAELDALVADLKDLTEVSDSDIASTLKIAETTVIANMHTKTIAVKVALNVVEDVIGSDVIVEYASKAGSVIVDEEADEAAIAEKVLANGIEAAAKAGWGTALAEGQFNRTAVLDGNNYTITYSPKTYTVTLGYAENMTVPYGYQYTLPVHEDADDPDAPKAYDYTVNDGVNKVKRAQGDVVVIDSNVEITRKEGKSYTAGNLYSIVADNYGDEIAKAILKSGALKGNEEINYREPDATALELKDGKLTADPYDASYEGFSWAPYTYGANGNENEFIGNAVEGLGSAKEIKVQYKLEFENYSEEEVKAILELAKALKDEADAQKATLDKMLNYYTTMGQLDNVKLGALGGVVDTVVEDEILRGFFKEQIEGIVKENLGSNKLLKIYNMLGEYKEGGLLYYYQNSEAVIAEIDSLSTRLSAMLGDDEKVAAIEMLVEAAGYPEYADKIKDLEGILATVKKDLTTPNAAIDFSKDITNLVNVLEADGNVTYKTPGHPYAISKALTALDESQVIVQVTVLTPKGEANVTTAAMDKGTALTPEVVKGLKDAVDAKVAELLEGNVAYYQLSSIEGGKIEDLANVVINEQVEISYTYTAKEYTVKIDGEDDQTVTIDKLYVTLPEHPTEGWKYTYTVDGQEKPASTYTFTLEQIADIFKDGSYTITRVETNVKEESFEENFGDWFVKDASGKVVALKANVDANKDGVMSFAMKLLDGGYDYVGLNGEPFVYLNEGSLEICMQTFVNALLNDEEFTSDMLIELGKNGKGAILNTTIQLGNEVEGEVKIEEDYPFTLYLNSVPSQMGTVSKGLDTIKDYLTFGAKDGSLEVTADLPEKVYEVYLAAMLATGNVEKTDITALNSAIAYQFLWDYIDIIVNSGATTQTYTNTLAKLGIDKDLTGYENYYNMVKEALSDEDMIIAEAEGEDFGITVNAPTKTAIDKLISVLGLSGNDQINLYVGYVKEYKGEGSPLTVKAIAKLADAGTSFEAALVDIKQPANKVTDHLNKFDFTDDLAKRANTIAGEAAIILLDDIGTSDPDGKVALEFNDATIIDLNGHTINGTVKANGKVLIFDSSLDTYNCGGVTGAVTGNATIVGGVYGSDVTAFLPDGYVLDGNTVRNALYTNEEDADGNVIFNIDANVINAEITSYTEAAAAIAADMAVDLVLNYFTSASLKVEEYSMYEISVEDIIGLYASTNRKEALINEALDFVSLDDLNGFINYVIDELMDFAAVEKAIRENSPILTLDAAVSPWYVSVEHEENGDYLAIGIVPNPEVVNEFSVGLRMAGTTEQKAFAANLIGGLSDIVVTENNATDAYVEILKPSYSNKHLSVSGTGYLNVTIDITEDQNDGNDQYGIDFTNEEYLNVFAVVVANGISNNTKKADLVNAVAPNGEMDYDAMKAAIDALTAKELFDALKNMSVSKDFAAMCQSVGVDAAELGDAATLEQIYHLVANAAGEVLEYFDVTGPESKLGNLYKDGYYQLSGTRSVSRDVSAKGYTLTVGAEEVSAELKVKLYPEIEEPEDCVHKDEDKNHVCDNGCGENVGVHEDKDHDHECDYGCDKPIGEHKDSATDNDHVCDHGCGEVLEECTPAEAVKENEVDATCSAEGSYDSVVYCEVCGEELSRETITTEKVAHTWKDTVYSWTETGDGMYCTATRECDVCGEDETRTVKAVGVVTEEGTCVKPSVITYTATFAVEDDWAEAQTKEADGEYGDHSYKATITKAPDCDDTGVRTYVCEHNAEHTYTETIPALGHDFGPWKVIEKPTTKKTGLKERVCEVCGHIETKIIARLDDEDDGFIFDTTRDDEENPSTGAPVKAGSALCAMAILAGAAYVAEKMRKH